MVSAEATAMGVVHDELLSAVQDRVPLTLLVYSHCSTITPDGYFLSSASKDGVPMLRHGETGDWYGSFQVRKMHMTSCVVLCCSNNGHALTTCLQFFVLYMSTVHRIWLVTSTGSQGRLVAKDRRAFLVWGARSSVLSHPLKAELTNCAREFQGAVWSCVLNEPALLCATGSADFSARVWDACSGGQLQEFVHPHIVRSVNFSHHSNKLATGCEFCVAT
eukprot:366200-Chlamydomonas_euryale.AAC.9